MYTMKEHHHNNHHGNGHHRRSSAHVEHINILDQLGISLKDELKRGLSLIDTSVNQLAQAKWILINIEKTLEGSYTDCPACQETKSKNSVGGHSPAKSKHSDHTVVKKEEQSPVETVKHEVQNSAKPGPKSKTKTKSPPPMLSVPLAKLHQPPCNYSREKAMSSKQTPDKDKPFVKLSDISNVIKGRRRVHLSDYPSLQGIKKKKRKISVSNDEISDSESCTIINQKKRSSDADWHSMASSKKRKHKSPSKKFKSKEIIESDDDSSSEEEKMSDVLKKKKHKHKHEKHHKHHSKSKVKEIGGKSSFFDKISLASDVTDKSENTKTSKSEKHHSVKETETKSLLEKVTMARSDVTDKSDSTIRSSKPFRSEVIEKTESMKTIKSEKEVKNKDRSQERETIPDKQVKKEEKSHELETIPKKQAKNEEKSQERDTIPEKQPKIEEKLNFKAMLLSKAKPDIIKQRLLEKFKQFTASKIAAPETKEKESSGEKEEMESIGLKIQTDAPKEKNKENFENSILNSIKTPMALQDMIEQDEINDKRSNSIDSVDEFIQSVLHNNNDAVTEKEIIKILKENYSMTEENKSVELKAETQIKIKEVVGQFQTIIVAHLQGGGSDSAGNKAESGSEGSPNSDGASNVEGAQGSSGGNTVTNNEQGNIVILNDSQLPSGELTIGNYFLIGREGYPLQLMKYVGGNNFEPLQMSNFTPQQLSVMKNSLL